MAYRSHHREQRWKAIAAVLVVHVALGAAIVSGLNVDIVSRAVERLQTFDITLPEPPPPLPPPPPPPQQAQQQRPSEGAPEKRPSPSPIVAPKPEVRLPAQNPVVAADVAGTGSGSVAGAGGSGTGTGSGGSGSGAGAGGGDGRGFTPAQRVSKIPNREYRRFVATSGIRRGRVGIMVKVNTDGTPSDCRIVRSSGSAAADALMCQLTLRHVRFRPARDPQGRPVAQDISWFPDWAPNR